MPIEEVEDDVVVEVELLAEVLDGGVLLVLVADVLGEDVNPKKGVEVAVKVDEAQGDDVDVIANREEGRLTRSRCWKMMLMWKA